MARPFTDFIHPDDRGVVMGRHLERMRGETPPTGYMFRVIPADGQERWVFISSDRIIWSGEPATLSFLTDLTGQRKAEERLVAASREYASLLAQIQDVYYRSDGNGRLVQASNSWATLLGYDSLDECLGRSMAGDFYMNPADRQDLVDTITKEGKVTSYPVLLKKKDGTPLLVETSSHLAPGPIGAGPTIEGIFRDVTERKRQETILRTQLALGLTLQKVTGMQETLAACLDAAIAVSGMDSGGIYLLDEQPGSLDLALSRNLGDAFVTSVSRYPADSATAAMVRAGVPLYLTARDLAAASPREWETEGLRSLAVIPISSGNTIIACLNISSHTDTGIPETTRVALETIATQIGAAIERIRGIAALSESEERYRTLAEASHDLIFVIDRGDRVVYVNSSAAAVLGRPVQAVIGHERCELFPPGISEGQKMAIRKVFETGTGFHSTGTLGDGGGGRWYDHSLMPIRDDRGTVTAVLGISRDITEQKHIEEELLGRTVELDSRNRLLNTLLDIVPIGIFMVEAPSGKPIIANREATRLLGRAILPDATDEYLSEVYKACQAGSCAPYPAHEMPIIRGMHGECSHVDDMIVVRPDLTEVRLEVFGTPVHDNEGRIVASLVCFMDVTGRRQAEETIRSLAQFPAENPNPVLRFSGDGALLYANPPGKTWLAALDDGTGQQVPARVRSLVMGARETHAIHTGDFEDGRGRVFEVTTTRPKGEEYLNMYISDITERRHAERTMQEAHEKINLLTSITRHDIANQVTIVRGMAAIAMMQGPDPDMHDILEKIDRAGAAIARHVEFTKTYQEIGMHAPGWFRLDTMIDKLKLEGVSFPHTCRGVEICADPMLEKVFLNLFDNAMRHGQQVTAVRLRCSRGPGGLTIFFEDNGIGIPPENKEKIFERGFGVNTGVGLFLSRNILAITGITLSETGVYGEGARFELHVPEGMYRTVS